MMKRIAFVCHFLFAVVILLFIVFPPFYAIDTKSNGKIHTAMGHYPIWNVPNSKDAYYCLINSNKMDAVVFDNSNSEMEMTQFAANFNTVRFIIILIIAVLVYLVLLILLTVIGRRLRPQ